MSAIAGVVHWDNRPVEPAVLAAMTRCMEYRCPDGGWHWLHGAVGLAQAEFATLPEDTPGILSTFGPLRIAADCRIDNRVELLTSLSSHKLPYDCPDALLVLAAYAKWGTACVQQIIGDFAFVIWDEATQTLFAARDSSGARQLFYYADARRLLIASDRTQILQDPTVPFEIDEQHVLEYLTPTYQWFNGWDQGLFHGFCALPAGHTLRAQDGHVRVQRFWLGHGLDTSWNEQQWLEAYLQTLDEAVRCRLRSRSHQIGVELSGGLDSPAVASLAARALPVQDELHTLSLVFDAVPEVDERARIVPVLDGYGLRSHMLAADHLFVPQCVPTEWCSQSIVGPQDLKLPVAVTRLSSLAVQNGCQVLLTGDQGDALNSGSALVFFDLFRRGRWREAVRRFATDWRCSWSTALLRVGLYGLAPFAPSLMLQAGLGLWERGKQTFHALPTYLSPATRERIVEVDGALRLWRTHSTPGRCPVTRGTLATLMPPMALLTTAIPQPVERRHPYTDRRLIELVLGMPAEFKWERGQPSFLAACRFHHRRALTGILPDAVRLNNVGVDFTPAIKHSLSPQTLRCWFGQRPSLHIVERGYIEAKSFWEYLEHGAEPQGYLATLLCLEGWLRALAPGGTMRHLVPTRQALA